MNKSLCSAFAGVTASVMALCTIMIAATPAEAGDWARSGANGRAAGFARTGQYGQTAGAGGVMYGRGLAGLRGANLVGPNGGTYQGAGGAILGQNAGLGGRAFRTTGPNGGTANGGGAFGYQRGVGAFGGTNLNAKGANGSTYNGYTRGGYNASTGQGAYNSSRQAYNAQSGQKYGYTDQSTFQKGQGGQSTIDTDNHGDYNVNYQKGQAPVVTQTQP